MIYARDTRTSETEKWNASRQMYERRQFLLRGVHPSCCNSLSLVPGWCHIGSTWTKTKLNRKNLLYVPI